MSCENVTIRKKHENKFKKILIIFVAENLMQCYVILVWWLGAEPSEAE